MRIRTLKPDFWHSPHQKEMTMTHRVLFVGLLNYVDDEGRGLAEPGLIRGQIFPYDDLTNADIEELVAHLVRIELVELYEHSGRQYLAIGNFLKHQNINRPKPSRLPDPKDPASRPFNDPSMTNHGRVIDESLTSHTPITDPSLLEQGTGNREQGRENTPSIADETLDLDDDELDFDFEELDDDDDEGGIAEIVELDRNNPHPPSKDRIKYSDEFTSFWELYPRRVGKGDAWRAWKALKPAERAGVLEGLHRHLEHWDRIEIPTQFIPHAATWLRQSRWEDDIETDTREPETVKHPTGWNALQRIAGQIQAQKEIAK